MIDLEGIPSEVFRQVTYAPSESIVFSDENDEKEKVWNLIKEYTANKYPFCATTKPEASTSLGLQQSHTYTVVRYRRYRSQECKWRAIKA